jgi:predicted nucleic-acid-binding Zn-ribbon protein
MSEKKKCPKCEAPMVRGKFLDGTSTAPSFGWESEDGEEWFEYDVYRCRKCNYVEFYAIEEE